MIITKQNVHMQKKIWEQKKKKTSPVGLEPTTFELEVQCANPLRHGDDWKYWLLNYVLMPTTHNG